MKPSQGIQKVTIRAAARLHLGFIDLHGGLGRYFGSLGLAIQNPQWILEIRQKKKGIAVSGKQAPRITKLTERYMEYLKFNDGVEITVWENIPEHVGLGSGTQLTLSIGVALATLMGKEITVAELAHIARRGKVSGVGTAVFASGGFVIDGGIPFSSENVHVESSTQIVPPVIVRHLVPEDWTFIVAIPNITRGLSGEVEAEAFHQLTPAKPEFARTTSRLVLMKLLPALVEDDIKRFGEALTAIQILVGDAFSSTQGGRFANQTTASCISAMLDAGAYGAGQSSWGPACYGLARQPLEVKKISKAAKDVIDAGPGGVVFTSKGKNQGAKITTE